MTSQRPQHYIFAHQALRRLFFDHPERVTDDLIQNGSELLYSFWNALGKNISEPDQLSNDGLDIEIKVHEDGASIFLVTLPPPQVETEAFFVALAYHLGDDKHERVTRYFTFERRATLSPDDTPEAVLCEWTRERQHFNTGQSCPPTRDEFLQGIAWLLNS